MTAIVYDLYSMGMNNLNMCFTWVGIKVTMKKSLTLYDFLSFTDRLFSLTS